MESSLLQTAFSPTSDAYRRIVLIVEENLHPSSDHVPPRRRGRKPLSASSGTAAPSSTYLKNVNLHPPIDNWPQPNVNPPIDGELKPLRPNQLAPGGFPASRVVATPPQNRPREDLQERVKKVGN